MFLPKFLILYCMIMLYIVEENMFFQYCLQAFSSEEILKSHIKDCLKVNGKQRIIMKGEFVKFKHYERKIKLPFMILQILKVL